ncbi:MULTISPECIES: alpha-L-arabinofuranosidase C-terminal domain-containing protein [unclassified Crossiella]|uniref:alpha-L-arabinofuranosidase C-terminal domain-containing protein n=1 Tax=unclassified Crossiella TaxID=2620835 RepID=UPI0020002F92|nr:MULTISPECIES: alpha-L-arabinofuranosidase C-terminal domain-containing protein [unclassified Crossiella]MCK2245017.1 carbohydrate binding domain-containing protein [Crossiella sp. S99.2]MCK2258742.1 carbohydrate binding domain-containing protein [Crossiella sp. S99.1]
MPRVLLCAALAASLLVALPGAGTAAETDYTLTVNPAGRGATIDDSMYGVFFEDINRAADGGLYAELVQNRSFEYDRADNAAYTGLTSWAPTGGVAEVVDDASRLHERNRRHLKLGLPAGVVNSGYNTGISLRDNQFYDFSVWARTDSATGTPLSVALTDPAGKELATPLRIQVRGDGWAKYTGSFRARATSTTARLRVEGGGAGTLRLDMVSLFPRDTYKNHGLRRDLAEKIAALKPGFVRFPGGCLVNTGSHYGYEAPNYQRRRSYQWKDTIGPVEQRAANWNFWGYNQSYGLGYFEYFQFAEDIGAMPLPVLPALVTGCGQNQVTRDPELLRRHIQDSLDLIEFATGPATSAWGRERAELGHPAPFRLTHLAVGNEENLPEEYFAHFTEFRKAIAARHPEITVVGNSGPVESGPTFDRLWQLNREAGVGLVDEHYYLSPQWFLANNHRYDSYDRNGPKVFLGEYAARDNRWRNSLAEAAYLTGLERNADVVKLASYAPLLANEDSVQWRPDLIWFNNHASWGSTSYQTQKLFMTNVGDHVMPSTASGTPSTMEPITGAIGLSTWATAASYDDVLVTAADGRTLFTEDFSGTDARWTKAAGRGSWAVTDGSYLQSDATAENTLVTAGNPAWRDYTLNLKATKQSGKEGFLIAFGVKDTGNLYWWNLGGWDNSRSAVEKTEAGGKSTVLEKDTRIETGRTYDLRVEVRGRQVALFLDGQRWGEFTDDRRAEPFRQVVTRDLGAGELIVKVVNAQDNAARVRLDLGRDTQVQPMARATTLQGKPDDLNTQAGQPIRPRTSAVRVSNSFTHTFPPHSITFLRIKDRSRS